MTDFYDRARRQGASPFIASIFRRYIDETQRRGVKPMSCKAFLAAVDQGKHPEIIGR
jgi:hypothetical protein